MSEVGLACYMLNGELWIDGEVDSATCDVFRRFLAAHRAGRITLNLSKLRFCDSSCLGVLFDLVRDGVHVIVRHPQPQVAKVFAIVSGAGIEGFTIEL